MIHIDNLVDRSDMTGKYEYKYSCYTCIRVSCTLKVLDLLTYVYERIVDIVRIIRDMYYSQTITQVINNDTNNMGI